MFRKDLLEAIACIKAGIDFHLKNQYRNAPELLLNLVSMAPLKRAATRPMEACSIITLR